MDDDVGGGCFEFIKLESLAVEIGSAAVLLREGGPVPRAGETTCDLTETSFPTTQESCPSLSGKNHRVDSCLWFAHSCKDSGFVANALF